MMHMYTGLMILISYLIFTAGNSEGATGRCPNYRGGINCSETCRCANLTDNGQHYEKYCGEDSNRCICQSGWKGATCNIAATQQITEDQTRAPATSLATSQFTDYITIRPKKGLDSELPIYIIVVTAAVVAVFCVLCICLVCKGRIFGKDSKGRPYNSDNASGPSGYYTNTDTHTSGYSYIDVDDDVFTEPRSINGCTQNQTGELRAFYNCTRSLRDQATLPGGGAEYTYISDSCIENSGSAMCSKDTIYSLPEDNKYHILAKEECMQEKPNEKQTYTDYTSCNGIYDHLNHSGRSGNDMEIIGQYESSPFFRK